VSIEHPAAVEVNGRDERGAGGRRAGHLAAYRQAGGTLPPVLRLPETQSRMFTSPSPLPLIAFVSTRLRFEARS